MKYKLCIDKNKEELVEATLHNTSEFSDRLEELVRSYNGNYSITAYGEDDIIILEFSQIDCITVIDSKTYAVDNSGNRYKLRLRLYEAAQLLPDCFIKINKSCIANRNRIEKFSAAFSGSVDVIFKSGYINYVSRRCFADIKKELKRK